jgi:hypothetical protein
MCSCHQALTVPVSRFLVSSSSGSSLKVVKITVPWSSKPRRPARPAICNSPSPKDGKQASQTQESGRDRERELPTTPAAAPLNNPTTYTRTHTRTNAHT